MAAESKRQRLNCLVKELETERQSFLPQWQDNADYVLPRRIRFNVTDVNRGDRRNHKIIDNTASLSARTLRSGMMSGVTSPARPWFRLSAPDPDLAEIQSVKEWLHLVSRRMSDIFLKSNLYNVLPILYGDMGTFGVGAIVAEEDFDSVIRFYSVPIGTFCLAVDERLKVNTFTREFTMTVRQLIRRFGVKDRATGQIKNWENFSTGVKAAYDTGKYQVRFTVCHVIQPNDEYQPDALESKHKKFSSCYFERGCTEEKFLSESGYDFFPVLAPRWETTGEDAYAATCPATDCIGDIKALQHLHKRKAQAVDKKVNPPMVAPTELEGGKSSILPGDVTYVDDPSGKAFRPAHEVNFQTTELREDIQEHQNRIQRTFFEDLFLMLSQSDRRQITAREVDERHEEKLLALGPVLEQLNQDLLDPLIDLTFEIMLTHGLIPKAPQELQGQGLRVEYISVMAQAQKLIALAGIERYVGFASQIIGINPDSAHKTDFDQVLDEYAEAVGLSPRIIRSDEVVAAMKAQIVQAQQQAQQSQMLAQSASAAKNLSQTTMEGDNALNAMIRGARAGALV